MENRYINKNKYKRSTAFGNKSRRKESISKKIEKQKNIGIIREKTVDTKKTKNLKKRKKISVKARKTVRFVTCIILLLAIAIFSRLILKEPDEGFFDIFKITVNRENEEILDLAILDNGNTLEAGEKNAIINELNAYSGECLLKVNNDYTITYGVISSIQFESNSSYILYLRNGISATSIAKELESFRKETSIYFQNLSNVKSIEVINQNELRLVLSVSDPLFIYSLQIPVNVEGIYIKTVDANGNIQYTRKEENSLIKSINVALNLDEESAVSKFKEGSLNMLVTGKASLKELIGRYEYDIKSYRTGEALMLFGNCRSNIFSRKEVRQAMAYSINREKIIENVYAGTGDVIDLPFIYSKPKYKYDIYAATNLLLTNGYTLNNSIFNKTENGSNVKLSASLLVNSSDSRKLKVAERIKEDLAEVGIEVIVEALSEANIKARINSGTYDLVLATVHLNENPSLQFIENYISVNETITNKFCEIAKVNSVEYIESKIMELENILSSEIACIGIRADISYLFTKKGLIGFDDISYMNIFTKVMK